jgi:hypothetical protein
VKVEPVLKLPEPVLIRIVVIAEVLRHKPTAAAVPGYVPPDALFHLPINVLFVVVLE